MAKYYRQDLRNDEIIPRPALELVGLRLARRAPLVAAMRAQDRVLTMGRRVVLSQGLDGAQSWLVPNTNPAAMAQTHPLSGVPRIVARSRHTLTQGHFLQLRAVVGLSGETQRAATAGEVASGNPTYVPDGANAEIRVHTTWQNTEGAIATRSFAVSLPPSQRQYGAAPTALGGQFAEERVVKINLIAPAGIQANQTLRRWSQPTVVTIYVEHVGGARVADLCIVEQPWEVCLDADDPVWCCHMLGATPAGTAPYIDFPYQRLSETSPDGNPRGGTWQMMDVANNQAERLGPTLLNWTAWDEDDAAVSDTDITPVTSTSSTAACITNSSISTYSASQEGWSFAAGAYARSSRYNDPQGMPQQGVIPIRVRVYGSVSDGTTTGILRLQTGPWEWVEVNITSTTAAWHTAYGYARVGKGPGDPSVVQAFLRRSAGAGTVSLYAMSVHHSGQFTNAA